MRRVVVVTDCTDVAFNEMCGAIHREADRIGRPVVVEPVVPVVPFSEINASFLTMLMADNYPEGTVLYTLVSKTNNLERTHEVIWGETLSGHLFVGSNFGYFGWLARDLGVKRVYEIKDVPQTPFSGKTFIAPIVARIAATDEEELTRHPYDVHDIHDVDIPAGSVVHVDNFGNAKLKVDVGALRNRDVVTLSVNGKPVCEATYIESQIYLEREQGKVVLYRSTSFEDMTDVGMVRGDFAGHHSVRVGDQVSWSVSR
ncbi:SAM-dependent chlorinase/fluorinase [Streptomyces hygroscopicus]|uniref:SAM-dependent chlorinase/fluorinase n=1 Tax=Streptomyces hygroscopicus TaxID=1912 RepID=UPI00099E242B|nr:SAM-dependent chlorinase/fluorinase [Streptomyces hygroscopicus]